MNVRGIIYQINMNNINLRFGGKEFVIKITVRLLYTNCNQIKHYTNNFLHFLFI